MRDLVDIEMDALQVAAIAAHRPEQRGKGRRVTVNRAESALSWLRARDLIDARQYEAGERLRADYELAALPPSVTMRWEPVNGVSGAIRDDPTEAQIDAKRRFDGAIAAVGSGLSDILWRIVCANEGLADAERSLGWPTRSGRLVLRIALDRLAEAYGLR